MKKLGYFSSRRFKHGSLATIITVLFLAALLVVNIIATLLLKRFPLNIDLSSDSRFGLTAESVNYVKDLKKEIKVYVCAKESDFESANEMYKQAYEVITSYTKHNPRITIEFVDLIKNPTFAQKFPLETLNAADIIVSSGKRYKKFSSSDLFISTQLESGTKYSSKAEQVMTSAIMYVLDENPTKAIVLNMGSSDLAPFVELLSSNNFEIVQQNLLSEDLDKSATMVVLPPLKADLTPQEIKKLDDFLSNDDNFDKTLIYVPSLDTPNFPNIDEYLAEWGLKVSPSVVMETNQNNAVNDMFNVINQIDNEKYTADLKDSSKPYITPYAHPIELVFDASGNRKTDVLAKTAPTTIAVPANADEKFDPGKATQQSYNTIAASAKAKFEGTTLHQSNLIIFGSEYSLDQSFIQYQAFNNGDYVANIASKSVNKKDGISIVPIDFSQKAIAITPAQKQGFTVFFMMVLPLLILIGGVVVWLRRRYR